ARIQRRLGTPGEAQAAYLAWERTIEGSCVEADLLYRNFCLAQDAARRNDRAECLRRWMRVALPWVAHASPECLGWRIASALVGRSVTSCDVDTVCDAVARGLRSAGQTVGLHPASGDPATFAYLVDAELGPLTLLMGRGFALLASDRCVEPV